MVCNHWQPGEVLHICQGAKEVQEALHALADRLCVIHWLAPWSASNRELGVEEVFKRLVRMPSAHPSVVSPPHSTCVCCRLAQDFPAVVFLQLSISPSHRCQGPNRLWALKTVCRRADSRRTGGQQSTDGIIALTSALCLLHESWPLHASCIPVHLFAACRRLPHPQRGRGEVPLLHTACGTLSCPCGSKAHRSCWPWQATHSPRPPSCTGFRGGPDSAQQCS